MVAPASISAGSFDHLLAPGGAIETPIRPLAMMGGSGFDAANQSTKRGYVYYPTVETKSELNSWSRTEILRRCRYLTRNVGFAKRCIYGLARMAGWLSPVPLTKDTAWNREAADLFERRYGASPLSFDLQGRQNFYSYQTMATATRLQDGDFFSVLTESAQGQAMVMSYEAHQVGDGNLPGLGNPSMQDGVRIDRWRKAQGFNFLDDEGRGTLLDARNVIQHADFLSIGHTRAPSALHHAVNHLLDRTELLSDLKTGSKIANRAGLYIVNQVQQQTKTGPNGMTVAAVQPTQQTPAQWTQQDLWNADKPGGKAIELGANQDLKQLLDQRPHPNTLEFLDYLCRDIAAGLDMAPEVLWNIAKLGGASVRYVMADAQKTVERLQQLLVDQFLTRFWVYFIAKEIAAGRLRAPMLPGTTIPDPDWYVVGWQPQAKLTVDIGREGKLSIDLHQAGLLTLNTWFGQQGQAWQHQIDQQIEEHVYKIQACERASKEHNITITPADIWGAAVARGQQVDPNADPLPDLNAQDVTPTTAEAAAA